MGVDLTAEPYLRTILLNGLNADLPQGWSVYQSDAGEVYYANEDSSSWEHPLDDDCRRRITEARARESDNGRREPIA